MRRTRRTPATGRVVFWCNGLDMGGAERQLTEVAWRLHERGRDVVVASNLPAEGAHADRLQAAGVPLHEPAPGARLGRWGRIQVLQGPVRPGDVLVTFLFGANLFGRLLRGRLRVLRLVTCFRAIDFGSESRHAFLRMTRGRDDVWTANSRAAVRALVADRVALDGRGHVISNGVDLPGLTTVLDGPFTWLSVGRLRPEKDHATLLRAWAALGARRGPAQLRLVGDGPQEASLRVLVNQLGITESVDFVGAVPDPSDEYRRCSAVVLSSQTEGSPNSILEAMSFGRPVVATDVGGSTELVEGGACGFLAPAEDPDALADRMAALMALDADARNRLGASGRSYVEAHHDWDRVVDAWEALLWPSAGGA